MTADGRLAVDPPADLQPSDEPRPNGRTPNRVFRAGDEWRRAQDRAAANGETLSAVLRRFLVLYANGWRWADPAHAEELDALKAHLRNHPWPEAGQVLDEFEQQERT